MSINQDSTIEEQMLNIYEEKLSQWPVPFKEVFVNTRYGETHLIVSGSEDNPPLVLLPGLAVTAMMWLPNIAALSRQYQCFALDVIGDHGKSQLRNSRRYPRLGKDYSEWLRQVYDGLGLAEAFLMGASNGGYAALNHALYAPEQVKKLVLLAPSGLELSLKKILPKIFYYLLFPTDDNREALVKWFLGDESRSREAFYQQLWLGMQGLPKVPIPIMMPANRLQKIKMPVTLILGENDPTISAKKGIQRVRKNIPQAKTVVIPGVGHVLNYEAGEQVEQLVIEFLGTGLISP